jgi:hypothetical protein
MSLGYKNRGHLKRANFSKEDIAMMENLSKQVGRLNKLEYLINQGFDAKQIWNAYYVHSKYAVAIEGLEERTHNPTFERIVQLTQAPYFSSGLLLHIGDDISGVLTQEEDLMNESFMRFVNYQDQQSGIFSKSDIVTSIEDHHVLALDKPKAQGFIDYFIEKRFIWQLADDRYELDADGAMFYMRTLEDNLNYLGQFLGDEFEPPFMIPELNRTYFDELRLYRDERDMEFCDDEVALAIDNNYDKQMLALEYGDVRLLERLSTPTMFSLI